MMITAVYAPTHTLYVIGAPDLNSVHICNGRLMFDYVRQVADWLV